MVEPKGRIPKNFTWHRLAPFAKYLNTKVCPKEMRIALRPDENVAFLSDGKLFVDDETQQLIFAKGFCIENFVAAVDSNNKSAEIYVSAFICWNEEPEIRIFKNGRSNKRNVTNGYNGCNSKDFNLIEMNRKLRFWLTIAGFVSIVFLVLTLFFYLTLPELQNFQGIIICAYILAIILTTSILIVIYNVKVADFDEHNSGEFFFTISDTMCKLIGYSLYFSGILMFCWMSVLCFDLFWTFVCTPVQLQNKKNNRRLATYFTIGMGAPVLMTAVIFSIDTFKPFKIRPDVGHESCLLSSSGARYFFNIPILIFLAFNTIIFVITTYSLWNSFKANEIATSQQSAVRAKVFNLKLLHQLVKTISLLSDVYVRRLCA